MDYVNGEDVTDNKHLAEVIDVTREGSAQPGSAGYDEPGSAGPGMTLRDSCFHVAIEELQKIQSAPQESQKEIDRVLRMLREAQNANNERRAHVMAKAHEALQGVWVPSE
ncbi:hypothetical protein OB955_00050 [Halobacteria archaeon AArc-m2/3/4]|uniref:Uncharacterized protein n=1 Tax=Natronoglomus mannanivorans TaxID=2979990 RepID=A0ABT2Q868_9EURY|nr:hypothetical protein [Halobacteria archaeon AArc-m2/3/4]